MTYDLENRTPFGGVFIFSFSPDKVIKGGNNMHTPVYNFGNIADWLSGIGTIAAVVVALYLAYRDRKPRAWVNYKEERMQNGGTYFNVQIMNTGQYPIYLRWCSIKANHNKGQHFVEFLNTHVDKILMPGDFYEKELFSVLKNVESWMKANNKGRLSTYVYFAVPNGKKYKARIRFKYDKKYHSFSINYGDRSWFSKFVGIILFRSWRSKRRIIKLYKENK